MSTILPKKYQNELHKIQDLKQRPNKTRKTFWMSLNTWSEQTESWVTEVRTFLELFVHCSWDPKKYVNALGCSHRHPGLPIHPVDVNSTLKVYQ